MDINQFLDFGYAYPQPHNLSKHIINIINAITNASNQDMHIHCRNLRRPKDLLLLNTYMVVEELVPTR